MVATASASAGEVERVAALLGGMQRLQRRLRGRLDAHEMILAGLPVGALDYLVANLAVIRKSDSLEKAVGISVRTFQRREGAPAKPLSREQGGRAWKFAEILARATVVFGSQVEAERWLERPALGLDGRAPIDLLATPAGVELVEEFLGRLEYGVYT